MKIAIHKSKGFYERWVSYCEENKIPYKIVNAYDSDIIEQLNDCTAFMWHHRHDFYKDILFANQLIYSLQQKGIKVFPDFHTTWHFDDKVGQKYLLEAINAPIVPVQVFYSKKEALSWIEKTSYPIVFKLRGGAGASNVRLVNTQRFAKKLIKKAFGKGFPAFDYKGLAIDSLKKYLKGSSNIKNIFKYIALYCFPNKWYANLLPRQKGYVYFQKYIPNNKYDIRVVVVDNKAFAIKRMCRDNDFRASGSGMLIYRKEEIDERCVRIALDINIKLQSQSTAFDFVFDNENNPLIVEISYAFTASGYDMCEGYWDSDMNWHEGKFNPYGWMIKELY